MCFSILVADASTVGDDRQGTRPDSRQWGRQARHCGLWEGGIVALALVRKMERQVNGILSVY